MYPLGEEIPLPVYQHPAPVPLKSPLFQIGFGEADATKGFDRIYIYVLEEHVRNDLVEKKLYQENLTKESLPASFRERLG
jgi:hypothetical protein